MNSIHNIISEITSFTSNTRVVQGRKTVRNYLPALSVAAVLTVSSILSGSTMAALVMEHAGKNNPVTETTPWTLFHDGGTGSSTGASDSGTDYWDVVSESTSRRYIKNGTGIDTAVAAPGGWSMTVDQKLISAASGFFYAGFYVEDGTNYWTLTFSDGTFDAKGLYYAGPGPTMVQISETSVDPTNGFHTYSMVYDPAGDSGSGSVGVYVDSVLAKTLTRAMVYTVAEPAEIGWGNSNGGGPGSNSRWAGVTFQTIEAPAPEPASVTLLGVGGLLVLRRRRA